MVSYHHSNMFSQTQKWEKRTEAKSAPTAKHDCNNHGCNQQQQRRRKPTQLSKYRHDNALLSSLFHQPSIGHSGVKTIIAGFIT